jgi:Zn-dependent protease
VDQQRTAQARTSRAGGTLGGLLLFGVPVRFHFTFLLLILFVVTASAGGDSAVWLDAVFLMALFGSVLLHELGHALAARSYGIKTVEIVMYPIGGVARLARRAEPRAELWIALAGPAVNAAICLALFAAARYVVLSPEPVRGVIERIAWGNLFLGAFNMAPAFPMDGGRVLRAALSMWKGEERATRIATMTGRVLAIAMGVYGIANGHVFLIFIAFLVYAGASQEGAASTGRALTHGIPVRAAMVTEFHTLSHGSTMKDAADLRLATTQQDFPVIHGGRVIGLLDRSALVRGVAVDGTESYVSNVMNRSFARLHPEMDLAEALARMGEAGPCALVMDGDRVIGLLTRENLAEFLLLRKLGVRPGDRVAE